MLPDLDDAKVPELKQQAIAWLVRLRDENISDEDMSAFADWLAKDYRHSEAFAYAEDLFDDMLLASSYRSADTQQTGSRIVGLNQATMNVRKKPPHKTAIHAKHWMPALLAIAAVWLFSVILVMPENSHPLERLLSDYHTGTGEIRDIQLLDGSHVLLNTNSAVSVNFSDSRRQIVLHHGQALFTVAKDGQRPFEVMADDINVKALGTVFEVDRHDAHETRVSVQQHAVRIDILNNDGPPENPAGVELQVGQRLHYRHDGVLPGAELIELDADTAWQHRRLFINDRPLSELIAELNRYRVGRIFLADAQLSNLRVTGVFSLDKPDDILRSVCDVLGLQQTRLSAWWVMLHR